MPYGLPMMEPLIDAVLWFDWRRRKERIRTNVVGWFFVILTVWLLFIVMAATGHAQELPKVCISQEAANKCVAAAAELIEARTVINEFQKERAASIAEREKAAVVIAGLNELVVVKDRVIAGYEQINALYKQVIELQQSIILKLEERLAKPKSAFSKFFDALKTITYFLAGAALGRGL